MLVTYYNGVPLILEEPVYAHGSLPRASREEVVRAILDDLNDIIDRELLDWQWTKAADQGRATRGAAMALKARLLLFEASKLVNPSNDAAKWQAAADAAKAVIEKEAQAGYDLFGDYRKLFLPANEHSCECVFNIEFSKTKNTAVNSFNVYSVQYRNNAPLLDLVMDYRTTTDGAATMGKYDNLDPRFAATNFYPGSTFLGKANCPAGEVCQFTGFAHRKLTIYDAQKRDSDDSNGETNYMFIRYADVLLMYAEAINEYAEAPDDQAKEAIREIRKRAGVKTNESLLGDYRSFRDLVRNERGRELAFEGLRKWDLIRWGTFVEKMHNAGTNQPTENKYRNVSYTNYASANYANVTARHIYLPIPTKELAVNHALRQNPLW